MKFGDVRKRYVEFFKNLDHKEIPSSPLMPDGDNTTLFINSGMQPLVPYLLGKSHPLGKRVVGIQGCVRTADIDEVGDNRHLTFFEMAGHWSLGDYFKDTEVKYLFKFLTDKKVGLGLDPMKLYVTVFAGDEENNIPKDEKVALLWQKLFIECGVDAKIAHIGSEEEGDKRGIEEGERIFYYDATKNWWSRAGVPSNMPISEPGGPDTEVFYDFGEEYAVEGWVGKPHPNTNSGEFVEIANSVFMEYKKTANGFVKLEKSNIDFGAGLERLACATQGNPDTFSIDVFESSIELLGGPQMYKKCERDMRIVLDHVRSACFIIQAGVTPSNTEQGYVLRKLIRRAIFSISSKLKSEKTIIDVARQLIHSHIEIYPNLDEKLIIEVLSEEQHQFHITLERGMKEFLNAVKNNDLSHQKVFELYTTYGFPFEMIDELAKERNIDISVEEFQKSIKEHKDLSKAGTDKKFKGGLEDNSKEVVAYHTATHLLNKALVLVLGAHVRQKGSNITKDRLRFDFTNDEKLTPEQIAEVEKIVNEQISKKLSIVFEDMPIEKAKKMGAMGVFEDKYSDVVRIYSIGDYSLEFCGGPHVENTTELGEFKITKQESISRGIRRIKAILV